MAQRTDVDEETGEIVRYSEFDQQLAEATSPAETRKVILEIDMLLKIAKAVGDTLERVNELQIARINGIRQAGRMLAAMERNPGNRTDLTSSSSLTRLSEYQRGMTDAQISRQTAVFWQNVAAIPEDVWEAYQDECLL